MHNHSRYDRETQNHLASGGHRDNNVGSRAVGMRGRVTGEREGTSRSAIFIIKIYDKLINIALDLQSFSLGVDGNSALNRDKFGFRKFTTTFRHHYHKSSSYQCKSWYPPGELAESSSLYIGLPAH